MENVRTGIQDDAMAQAVLGAIIKKGPLTEDQIHSLFLSRSANDIQQVLARLRQAQKITSTRESTGGHPKNLWGVYDKSNETTQTPGARFIFCSLRFPFLSLGNKARFESGFYETADPEKIELIKKSSEFNLTVRDLTEALRREMPLTDGKRIFLSLEPSLVLSDDSRFRVHFLKVADGLGIFSSDIPDCHRLIEQSQLFRTGKIREVPRTVAESAGKD